MINNILNAMSDPNFRIRAFTDYCEARQANYSQLINALNATVAIEYLDDDDRLIVGSQELDTKLLNIIHDCGLQPDMQVTGQQGYYGKLIDLLKDVAQNELDAELGGVDYIGSAARPVFNAKGQQIASLSNVDMFDDFKQGLHAITALVASNTAYLQSNFSDSITIYRDKISEVFANAFSDVSGAVDYYSKLLQQRLSPQEYLTHILEDINIDELAADDSEVVPVNSKIFQYTGASPAGALDFSDVSATVSSVANVGAKVVASIGSALWSGAKWVFNKAKKYITETVVNPYDVYKIDNPASEAVETIDGFCYQTGGSVADNDEQSLFQGMLQFNGLPAVNGHTYVVKLVSGELCMTFNNAAILPNGRFSLTTTEQFKPKPITKEFFCAFLDLILNQTWLDSNDGLVKRKAFWNVNNIHTLPNQLSSLIARFPNMYYDTSSSEEDLYLGYCLGYVMTMLVLRLNRIEVRRFDSSINGTSINEELEVAEGYDNLAYLLPVISSGSIGNIDFVKAASGYYLHNSKAYFSRCPLQFPKLKGLIPSGISFDWQNVSNDLLCFITVHENLKEIQPLDYPFYSYRKDKERFSPSMYAIHSDEENKEAFNNFATNLVVTAVLVVATMTGVVLAKKLSRAIAYRRESFASAIQSKMWNGETLSNREKRKYFRLQTKNKSSSSITMGLLGALGSTADDDASSIKDLYSLIRG